MDRRDFLKSTAAAGLLALLPFSVLDETVTIVDYGLYDGWIEKCVSWEIGKQHKDCIEVSVSIDYESFWRGIYLQDGHGNYWHTPDQGHTWSYANKSFNMDGEVWQA